MFRWIAQSWILLLVLCFLPDRAEAAGRYWIGTGRYDITGPASNLGMQGYVRKKQKTAGIHTRLWSRAFVIADGMRDRHVALVVTDLAHVHHEVKAGVMERLKEELGPVFGYENVLISATHTHSGPGGYAHHAYYNFRIGGFSHENFRIIVEGIAQSILQAYGNLTPGRMLVAEGDLNGASVNRSLPAYLLNPSSERSHYGVETDPTVSLIKFVGEDGRDLGLIHWFAVHAVTVEGDNLLIDGDNKGFAAHQFEVAMSGKDLSRPGFVAAFANANAGDSSPHVAKDKDGDGDWDCDSLDNHGCAEESGNRNLASARELYARATEVVEGELDYRHRFARMAEAWVGPDFTGTGHPERTCQPAIGLSMLAGSAEDGPGVGQEGWNCDTVPPWGKIFCHRDPCQGMKPAVLLTGETKGILFETPQVLPIQVMRIGQIALVGLPGEVTTMSGRRIRDRLRRVLAPAGIRHVILAGYANSYASYVTTREEYQAQHYEGASTHFGEWTQAAYAQYFEEVARSLASGTPAPAGEEAPRTTAPRAARTVYAVDSLPPGATFGQVTQQPAAHYQGGDSVVARFWGGQPGLSPKVQDSYVLIQRRDGADWKTVAWDWNWETFFSWSRTHGRSQLSVEWRVPVNTPPGTYRIVHRGTARARASGPVQDYEGVTRDFSIVLGN